MLTWFLCWLFGHVPEKLRATEVYPLQSTGWGFAFFIRCKRCRDKLLYQPHTYPTEQEARDMLYAYTNIVKSINIAFEGDLH